MRDDCLCCTKKLQEIEMKTNMSKGDKMKTSDLEMSQAAKIRFRNQKEKNREDIKHDRLLRSQAKVDKSNANEIEIIETHEMETGDDSQNPINWSISDVCKYLKEQKLDECIVDLIRDDEVDGQSFLLLDLPTVMKFWKLKLGPSLKLANLVEKLKLSYFNNFYYRKNSPNDDFEVDSSDELN